MPTKRPTEHDQVTDEENSEDLTSLATYLSKKQEGLKSTKEAFDKNVELAEQKINSLLNELKSKTDQARNILQERLKQKVEMRRSEFARVESELSLVMADFGKTCAQASPNKRKKKQADSAMLRHQLQQIRKAADECFRADNEEYKAFTTILVRPNLEYLNFVSKGPSVFFDISSSLDASDFKVKLLNDHFGDMNDVWLEVSTVPESQDDADGSVTLKQPSCPQTLISEFTFCFEMGDEKVGPLTPDKLKVLRNGNPHGFYFRLDGECANMDVMVHVFFCDKSIRGSPLLLSIRNNVSFRMDTLPQDLITTKLPDDNDYTPGTGQEHNNTMGREIMGLLGQDTRIQFEEVGVGNVTRTGKNTSDLDQSDRRAMDYTVATHLGDGLSTVQEVSNEGSGHQEPVMSRGRQQGLLIGPQGSPMVARGSNLPLEQPSPCTPIPHSRAGLAPEVPSRAQFTPGAFSTAQNLQNHLRSLEIPETESNAVDCNGNGVNNTLLEQDPGADVASLAKDLSGDKQDNNVTQMNKSVSFHPSTTIFETVERNKRVDLTLSDLILNMGNKDDAEASLRVVLDRNAPGESNVRVMTGHTKMVDGNQDLHKSLLNNSRRMDESEHSWTSRKDDSAWNYTPNTWKEIEAEKVAKAKGFSRSDSVASDTHTIWGEVSSKPKVPDYDLALDKFKFTAVNSRTIKGLPQSVTRHVDEAKDMTFVTDVEHNKIHHFNSWSYQGEWKPDWPPGNSFLCPRYALCIPNDRIVVLDNKALYVFSVYGKLLKKLFDGEVKDFRGLAYLADYGRLITTTLADDVVMLIFIDTDVVKGVVQEIPLEPTRGKISTCKVRFLASHGNFVASSDLGTGQVYLTNLSNHKTIVLKQMEDGANRLKDVMGLAFDPAGNLLAASSYHKRLELFDPEGNYGRSFELRNMDSATGLCIHGRFIYVVDSVKQSLSMFIVAETEQS